MGETELDPEVVKLIPEKVIKMYTVIPIAKKRKELFEEVNIEIFLDMRYKGQGFEITIPFTKEYILDFENSFTETGENYGETYSHRKNLRRILNDLVRISDKDVRRALNGEINLKGKRFSFKSDNGLNVDENFYFRKRGRFRCGGKKAIILNRP